MSHLLCKFYEVQIIKCTAWHNSSFYYMNAVMQVFRFLTFNGDGTESPVKFLSQKTQYIITPK